MADALNTVARARAEQGDAAAFRLMQRQCMRVGQRRVELDVRIAELERARLSVKDGFDCAALRQVPESQRGDVPR